MYIEPDSEIRMLTGVRISPGYQHSIYFDNREAQEAYFLSKTKLTFSKQSYQRVNKGTLRVRVNSEGLLDCTYLMFKNKSFGTRWFYAFILEVNYIANLTCEVVYALDHIQTWYLDYTMSKCFIVRHHAASDEIGENIVPEPVILGDYKYSEYSLMNGLGDLCVFVQYSDEASFLEQIKIQDQIVSGAQLKAFSIEDIGSIAELLFSFKDNPDSVINMYMGTSNLFNDIPSPIPTGGAIIKRETSKPKTFSFSGVVGNEQFDGYVPHNRKLYTYPYTYFSVGSIDGNEMKLPYEYFDGSPKVNLTSSAQPPFAITCRPYNFKGSGSGSSSGRYFEQSLTLGAYPMCSWQSNAYAAWSAQNTAPLQLNMVSGAMGGLAGAFTKSFDLSPSGAIGTAMSLASGVKDVISGLMQTSIALNTIPNPVHGNSQPNEGVSAGDMTFHTARAHIAGQYCRTIDTFFDKYGYSQCKFDYIAPKCRRTWCFIQTADASGYGNIPRDAERAILNAYNNGLTWWMDGDKVGEYHYANPTV